MDSFNEAVKEIKGALGEKQNAIEWKPAMTGDGHGLVDAGNGMIYVRLGTNSSVIQVINGGISLQDGVLCRIEKPAHDPLHWYAIRASDQHIDENGGNHPGLNTEPHARTHRYLGVDQVDIDWRQIENMRMFAVAGTLTVRVMPFWIPRPGADVTSETIQTIDLTSHVPTSGARFVLLSIDSTGAIVVTDGALKDDVFDLDYSVDVPDTPSGNFQIAAVRLYTGQTAIQESTVSNDIRDRRWPQERIAGDPLDQFGPQAANTVFRGPESGVDATPFFGSLVDADIPATIQRVGGSTGGSGLPLTTLGDLLSIAPISNFNQAYHRENFSSAVYSDASASSTYLPVYTHARYALSELRDSDPWATLWWTSGYQDGNTWLLQWQCKFVTAQTITGWLLTYRSDAGSDLTRLGSYMIESSNDGSTWSTVVASFAHTGIIDGDTFASPVTASYFRFTALSNSAGTPFVPGNSYNWSIQNVKLYSATGTGLTRIPIGTLGQVLATVDDGSGGLIPGWETSSAAAAVRWYNILDYGADGTLTNDDAAVADAVAAMPANGGDLYFPTGTWLLSPATFTKPVVVFGDGSADAYNLNTSALTVISTASATGTLFNFNSQGCAIRDVVLLCTASPATAGSGVTAIGDRFSMEHVKIQGFYDNVVITGAEWNIHGCYIAGPRRYGVVANNTAFSGDFGDWSLSDTVITSLNYDATAGLYHVSGGGGKITNCKFNGWLGGHGFDYGIEVAFPAGIGSTQLQVSNTSVENVHGDGIHITVDTAATFGQIIINGVQFGLYDNATGGHAISIVGVSASHVTDVVIDDCVFRATGSPGSAIDLAYVDTVAIGQNVNHGFSSLITTSNVTDLTRALEYMPATVADGAYTNADVTIANGVVTVISNGASDTHVGQHIEVVMAEGITPPDPILNVDGTGWIYAFVDD